MSPDKLKAILSAVAEGKASVDDAIGQLQRAPIESVMEEGKVVARLDTHRRIRHGFPEVILAEGKKLSHLTEIVRSALAHGENLLITRLSEEFAESLCAEFPDLQYSETARCGYREIEDNPQQGLVAVLCAGTSDINVAEEAVLTARLMGAKVERHYDAGVAGLHRLLSAGDLFQRARVFIVAAGMEGALPSVVGGLVDNPVIAVPTSVGYGASFNGLTALLGMLNSCSANVTAVNIDNGFGAGYVAALINRLGEG